MLNETHDIELKGCSPVPLAYYLKGLGILRLIVEQVDPEAKCYWKSDSFHLKSKLDKGALLSFFLEQYNPTPVMAPWNGGSGFYYQEEKLKETDPVTGKKIKSGRRNQPTAATKAVDAIIYSSAPRFSLYRDSLQITKDLISELGLQEAPGGKAKEDLIQAVRNRLPDSAIGWLDASVVLTSENAKYPPLLGTGGNDGNADFSSNFIQRLCGVFDPNTGRSVKPSAQWLEGALFAETFDGLIGGIAIGQFFPGAVGGANAESGFGSDSQVNPWDYIFMIEGTLFFAAATVKRLQASEPGVLSYPFSVNSSGVGYGSASQEDEATARAEIWIPLWERPSGMSELRALMGEGRAQVGSRPVRNGVDFARAVAGLGIDRGLKSFQRYSFLERNGHNFFAVALDRFMVSRQPQVDLLSDVDSWMASFGAKAKSDKAPASAGRALRLLETAIFALCKERGAGRVQDVLISLGQCEKAICKGSKWAKESFLRTVPALSDRWLKEADDGSPEFRLAASLASIYGYYSDRDGKPMVMPLRSQMEPVRTWLTNGHIGVALDEDEIGRAHV
jgi:CRISPR-associated protein Csx17